jgi:hypothetical protein
MPFQRTLYAKKSLIESITDQRNVDQIPMINTFAAIHFASLFGFLPFTPRSAVRDVSSAPGNPETVLPNAPDAPFTKRESTNDPSQRRSSRTSRIRSVTAVAET